MRRTKNDDPTGNGDVYKRQVYNSQTKGSGDFDEKGGEA